MNQTATYQTASRGFAWSFFASGISTAASLAAQLLLGRLLSEGDFGEYAIAIGLANLLAVLREGGITSWLARMLPDEYDENLSVAQCLSYLLAWVSMPLLFLLGWLAGNIYGSIAVRNVMWILALAFPFHAYSSVGRASMQSTLRFATLARLRIVTDLLRYSLIVVFALMGFGAVSFALPVLMVAIIECICFRLLTRLPVWPGFSRPAQLASVFSRSKWSWFGSLAQSLLRNADYVVLGLLVPKEVVGAYFFAFQLTMQPVTIFAESLRKVVLPVFARLEADAARRQRALHLAGIFLGTVATPAMLLLSALAGRLTVFLWDDRWMAAIGPIRVLSVAMVFQLAALVSEAVVQSHGQFRAWTIAVFTRGIGLGLCALLAGTSAAATPTSIAELVALYLAITAVVQVARLLNVIGLDAMDLLRPALVPFLLSSAAAYCVVRLDAATPDMHNLTALLVLPGVYLVLVAVLFVVCCPAVLRQALGMVDRFFRTSGEDGSSTT